jgi:bifunctional non-homologous end joining protein LigD
MPRLSEIISIDGHKMEITNLDKVLYPGEGITKGELIEYYARVAGVMLPHVRGRLVTMRRFPGGVRGEKFYQKSAPEYFPEFVNRVPVRFRDAGEQIYMTCENRATLVYLANLAVIPHVWTSRVDRLHYPDRLVFDLDPPDHEFEPVRYAALILREVLKELGLEPFVTATGSRGAHVVVPLDRKARNEEVTRFASGVADYMAEMAPEQITTEMNREKRGGRLFVDVFRNSFAQTSVAPYAAREYPGAPVAAPLSWEELADKSVNSRTFTIKNILPRLGKKKDPWKEIFRKRFSVEKAAKRLKIAQ